MSPVLMLSPPDHSFNRLLKNYLRGHRRVKNRLKMLIYNS
ncbi:hypothetical protein SAMN05216600_10135 [Pseudomonas cuatrocienegasensis]|uniref:Uncharacterized protein n=1 Tax=Pseudomonas cuatrocienegasensis TaxID=543360 RepID=A0ABY1AZU0_9PSED|nr:hypothetical protein SAMN05216600_10135 [Pseudomonas cuatrocienegasensis]